ncbi:LCP family protein [Streptomyces sp. S.PB5]|uniref:LCP family protein n=1 Tax=Streptomyces sp. S.PB5 TaxID=3020844 RepID=UPI0025B1B0D0|nr:LCP family protein [Streptomyces sp. S.PB5]MDN3025995.1 LCP family protein [Streptomyces sp. S.PB5]
MTTASEQATAPGRAQNPRRRGPLRTALLVTLVVTVLGMAGVGWICLKLNSAIGSFGEEGLSKARPEAGPSEGENVLVIGSDARNDGNSALGGGSDDDIGRSDTAFLLHIYADRKQAVVVSIPRDTLVTVPPCRLPDGTWTKSRTDAMFNSAFSVGQTEEGNPACTQNTVEELTGLRVDHTMVIDFKGFAALTEVVGGVEVCLPKDVYERDLDPDRTTRGELLLKKGVQTVSGQKALTYVRIRHGIGDGSDMGRIKRQQAFAAGLVKKIKREGLTPARLLPLADAAARSMTVDPGLGTAKNLLSFTMSLKGIDLRDTKFVTMPWRYEGARVAVVQPDAAELWAALKADRALDGKETTTTIAPASPSATESVAGHGIGVAVYNGTTVSGLASAAATTLTEHGFTVTGTANASNQDHSTTVIQYGLGLDAQAAAVARLFPDARLQLIGASGINVILGRSYATADASVPPVPTAVPTSVTDNVRSADDDPCSDLSYG